MDLKGISGGRTKDALRIRPVLQPFVSVIPTRIEDRMGAWALHESCGMLKASGDELTFRVLSD
jgi:hypothetical protein